MHFLAGMVQFLIVFLFGLVVGINFGSNPLALIVVMVVYTLAITALGLALAPHMRNENQVGALTTLLAIVLAALGGAWWPLSIAPQFMQVIGHLTPVAWAMDAFQQLLFYNGGLGDVLLPVAVLAGMAAVLFGLGILTFKYD
jgi:ABC-2 type transport system permease protein